MTTDLVHDTEAARFDEMNQVMELYVKNVQPGKIAKQLGIRRVDVLRHVEEWKQTSMGSDIMRERVDSLLATMDEHFSTLIREAWKTLDSINGDIAPGHQLMAQRATAIKVIADLEQNRIDIMQKAGMLENDELGDAVAEQEEKHAKLIAILQEVTSKCPNCRHEVASRLSNITDTVSTIDIEVVEDE